MVDRNYKQGRDPLTGLMDFHTFLQYAHKTADKDMENGTYPSYDSVCFDISNFRHYNNIYGMEGGDRCLQKVAQILSEAFPETNVCRRGSDKFITMVRKEGEEKRIEEACRRVNEYIGNPGVVLNAGIYSVCADSDIRVISGKSFDYAKLACDTVKNDRSRVFAYYTPGMGKAAEDRSYILENFERALADGTISVCFQPVVRSLTGKFCNSEALARWNDPVHGSIRPDVFIRVLEDARLINKLDLFVLRRAAEIMRFEIDNKIPCVPISVNFSRLDFILMDSVSEVEKIMKEYDLPSSQLCIEITESALLEDQTLLQNAITSFKEAGYQVWLDDFGSGYSSLNVLNQFPIDEIKLDMGFLKNYNEKSRDVIKAIVQMAKTLGLHILAEGVETKEQADFLISIGCEKMQGYYYAKPMYLDTAINYPQQSNIAVETPEEEKLMNTSGAVNVITDQPVGFSIYDGERYRIIYANEAYRRNLKESGFNSLGAANSSFTDVKNPRNREGRNLRKEAMERGKGSVLFRENGQYMHHSIEKLSEAGNLVLFKDELVNLHLDSLLSIRNSLLGLDHEKNSSEEGSIPAYDRVQIEARMSSLRTLFDVVRLVDPSSLRCLAFDGREFLKNTEIPCHEFWKSDGRCVNCISARAVTQKARQTKVEFQDDRAFFVLAEPVNVNGRICSLECVLEMKDILLSAFGKNIFRHKIESMNKKIYMDSLTGIYNRRYYDEIASGLFSTGVAFLDVDHFKHYNDEYGHAAGDRILHEAAQTIKKAIRDTDGLIRYGGDEFLLFFTNLHNPDTFKRKLEKIRQDVAGIRIPDLPDIVLSISIGAVFDFKMVGRMRNEADKEMYKAKKMPGHISVLIKGD